LRRENPVLRPKSFGDFNTASEDHDLLKWYNAAGEIMSEENWHDPECRTISRFSERLFGDGSKNSLLLIIHGNESSSLVTLPKIDGSSEYEELWNSAQEAPTITARKLYAGDQVQLSGTSMLLLRVN
jgi:glycogen operon protein